MAFPFNNPPQPGHYDRDMSPFEPAVKESSPIDTVLDAASQYLVERPVSPLNFDSFKFPNPSPVHQLPSPGAKLSRTTTFEDQHYVLPSSTRNDSVLGATMSPEAVKGAQADSPITGNQQWKKDDDHDERIISHAVQRPIKIMTNTSRRQTPTESPTALTRTRSSTIAFNLPTQPATKSPRAAQPLSGRRRSGLESGLAALGYHPLEKHQSSPSSLKSYLPFVGKEKCSVEVVNDTIRRMSGMGSDWQRRERRWKRVGWVVVGALVVGACVGIAVLSWWCS